MDDLDAELVAGRRRRVRVAAALTVVAAFVSAVAFASPLPRVLRGEIDWSGQRVYAPPHTVSAAALRRIDLDRVHRDLFPTWVLAAAGQLRGPKAGARPEAVAYAELAEAVADDPNLAELAEALRAHVRDGGLRDDPERALYLAWAWSTYVDRAGYPFLVHGSVLASKHGPVFSAVIYETHADATVSVGVEDYRVRVGSRIDGTNVRELYLGAAGREDAIIVVDRLREFALNDLWPMLEPALDELSPARAPFAPAIRREAQAGLPPRAFEALQAAAVPRWAIIETVVGVHNRRNQCSGGLTFNRVPWYGFGPDRIRRLRDKAERDAGRPCPAITDGEVEALELASNKLLAMEELQPAVEALVAWGSEHVAIHEARHLADDALADGFEDPLPCPPCSDDMGIVARAELSGYLASIAWGRSPGTALFQACRAIASRRGTRGGGGVTGPHAEAMELLQRRIGRVCMSGPPENLSGLGRSLEEEMLGRSEPMALSDAYPSRFPVSERPEL